MSVGHIYRYFAGKDEIIKAIVLRNVEDVISRFMELERSPGDLYQSLVDEVEVGVADAVDPERAALMIEVRAEAGRNAAVATTVQAADQTLRDHLARAFVRAGAGGWTDRDVKARVEMLALIFEGISLRTIAHPGLDQPAMAAMIRRVIHTLFERAV
jgi:AcrR family transcriptional regulator